MNIIGKLLLEPYMIPYTRVDTTQLTEAERLTYRAMLRLQWSGRVVDLMSVTSNLNHHGELEKVGGQQVLAEWMFGDGGVA